MSALNQISGWVRGQSLENAHKVGWFDKLSAWVNGYRFFCGSFTRDITTATGTQAVTGIPFRPSAVMFLAGFTAGSEAWSVGIDDSDAPELIYSRHLVTADTVSALAGQSIGIQGTAGNNYLGNINTLDASGFTISWTKTGAPSGTATIYYLAFR